MGKARVKRSRYLQRPAKTSKVSIALERRIARCERYAPSVRNDANDRWIKAVLDATAPKPTEQDLKCDIDGHRPGGWTLAHLPRERATDGLGYITASCYDRKGRHTHSRKVTQPLSRAVMDENCELREALQLRDYFRDLSTARKASLVDLSPIGTPVRTPVRSSPSANSCSVGESSTLGERQRFVDSPQSITPSSGSSVEYPPSSSSPLTTLTGSSPMFTVHSPNASLVYSTSSPNSSPALSDDSPSKRRNPARHARPSSFWFPADTQQNASPITVGSSVISTDDEEFNSSGSDGTRVNELSDSEDDVSFIASIFKPYTNRSPPPCLRDYLYGSANSSPGIPRPTRSILYPETDLVNDVDASPFINNEACDIEIQIEMYLGGPSPVNLQLMSYTYSFCFSNYALSLRAYDLSRDSELRMMDPNTGPFLPRWVKVDWHEVLFYHPSHSLIFKLDGAPTSFNESPYEVDNNI